MSKFMPEVRFVNLLHDSAIFRRLKFRAKYIFTLTGNVFKRYACKQTFAVMCSFIVSVNKLRATDSSISPDE